MDDVARTARAMWTLFEPVHAMTYFTPEPQSVFEKAGVRGFWRRYFAGRAAPLGPAGAATVSASFFTFAPAMVARAVPAVWDIISPEDAERLRLAGASQALRRLLTGLESQAAVAAGLLWRAIDGLDCAGRVLAAAHAAQPVPEEPMARLWQAATVLREHRGDGHFAALVAAGVDGCEALVLRCGLDLRREDVQPLRGWTDEQWDDAQHRLAGRGWIGESGELTNDGIHAHGAVEDATDRAAARPWSRLGDVFTGELAHALTPVARACAAALPYQIPVGIPAPRSGR